LGRNLGPKDGMDIFIEEMVKRIRVISEANGGVKVSLIGWSLGGLYAREVAKAAPELIRQVITLGTPFKLDPNATNVTKLYEILSKDKSHLDMKIIKSLSTKPGVPFTSVYSKTDGVVAWKCSLEIETKISENIEIPGASHMGLGHNPISMHIIANRLSQPEDEWRRYR
jgi:alpha-beta hydrolase superfamily lysophospholipase